MRISILCNSVAWGGLEMLTCNLAHWLSKSSHEISVFCPPNSRTFSTCVNKHLTVIPFLPKSKYADFQAISVLKKYLQNQDILLIPQSKDVNLGVLAKKFGNTACKLVYLQNMQIGVDKRDIIHTYFYRNLDAWITPLQFLKNNTLQRTRIQAEKIHLIPFGIETANFGTTKISKEEARNLVNLPQNVTMVGNIGRIDPGKGQEYILQAIHILKQQGKTIHAAIIGEETYGDKRNYLQYLQNLSKELEITELIHFVPFQKDATIAYRAIDIFAMTSTHETYGLVTIEAMAAKMPIVAGFAGGTTEIIKDKETGLFFISQNAEDLAKKIMELVDNPTLQAKIASQAQQVAIQVYDYQAQIQSMNKLFEQLCS
jgi:D-inositol-3-phosphate glycosyltransferase